MERLKWHTRWVKVNWGPCGSVLTVSNGGLDPGEVCQHYAEAGYDFLCMSDHFMEAYGYLVADTTGHRTNRFTTILGAEMHTGSIKNGEIWHILAVGLPPDFASLGRLGHGTTDDVESGPEIHLQILQTSHKLFS